MEALTETQVGVLNNVSNVRSRAVDLGDILQEMISFLPVSGTPVNAVNATAELNVSGVGLDSETVTIGADVYEFLTDDALTKTDPDNIPVDLHDHATKASQSMAISITLASGETFTIGTKTYIMVPNGTANADGEVAIGTDLATCMANVAAAINGTDGHNTPHPLVTAGEFADGLLPVTALIGGTAGNSIVTTETFIEEINIWMGATLEGGANASAANTASHLLAAINASGTEPVTASDNGSNKIGLTADVAGVLANSIALSETMTNGAFTGAVTHMTGGVNGTLGDVASPRVDSSYLYICIAENTVSGKNWRRISLGSAY